MQSLSNYRKTDQRMMRQLYAAKGTLIRSPRRDLLLELTRPRSSLRSSNNGTVCGRFIIEGLSKHTQRDNEASLEFQKFADSRDIQSNTAGHELIQLKTKTNPKFKSQTKEIPDEFCAEIYADDLCIKQRIKRIKL